jgi:hypothetical protein
LKELKYNHVYFQEEQLKRREELEHKMKVKQTTPKKKKLAGL